MNEAQTRSELSARHDDFEQESAASENVPRRVRSSQSAREIRKARNSPERSCS